MKVQLATVLERLPQMRAQADGFRQQGNGLIDLARGCELDGLIQHAGRVRNSPSRAPSGDVKVGAEDQAEARDLGRAVESPRAQEEPAGCRHAGKQSRHNPSYPAPLARARHVSTITQCPGDAGAGHFRDFRPGLESHYAPWNSTLDTAFATEYN